MKAITFSGSKKMLFGDVRVVDTSSFNIGDVVSVKYGNKSDCDFSPYEKGEIVATRESEFTGRQFLVHLPEKGVYSLCTCGDETMGTHLYTTCSMRGDEAKARKGLGF